ncbi:hypothetical protein Moror_12983 [Moniliophthora roreri MCA 2997]|uniref:Uncharacterized protein n=1 Tax=Moniliophthora roreri (strain MCA 2997) TaxID=1381753 RepID=V2XM28_MONRO|nr:hypothetical protein Moror_12983 [Moniliophthora roreri MCA 2997]
MVLTVKSVQSLPIPDLKIKASSGSPAALFELGRRASQRPHLLVEVLPIFLNHLSSPPDFSTLKESQRDERIAAKKLKKAGIKIAIDALEISRLHPRGPEEPNVHDSLILGHHIQEPAAYHRWFFDVLFSVDGLEEESTDCTRKAPRRAQQIQSLKFGLQTVHEDDG